MRAVITRDPHCDKQTLGEMKVFHDQDKLVFVCKTLELPWKNNQENESCIPVRTYQVKRRHTEEFKDHFHVWDLNSRSEIMIRSGNYYTQIVKGCILVGDAHTDINNDGYRDVVNTENTMRILLQLMPDEFELNIECEKITHGEELEALWVEQTVDGMEKLAAGFGRAVSEIGQAAAGVGQPSATSTQPSDGTGQPAAGAGEPVSDVQSPDTGAKQAEPGIGQPPAGVEPPLFGFELVIPCIERLIASIDQLNNSIDQLTANV